MAPTQAQNLLDSLKEAGMGIEVSQHQSGELCAVLSRGGQLGLCGHLDAETGGLTGGGQH